MSLLFSLLGSLHIYLELIPKVVGELEVCVPNVLHFLGQLLLLYMILKFIEEKETLTELDVLIKSMGKTVADLLQIKVSKSTGDFL